jgi:hypothetical protein
MSFDPVGAAVDWLDAYRKRDLDGLVSMFADDAIVDCSCCVVETVTGRDRLRTFWLERFEDCGASEIHDVWPHGSGASISYIVRDGLVTASITFATDGKIVFIRWSGRHPSACG